MYKREYSEIIKYILWYSCISIKSLHKSKKVLSLTPEPFFNVINLPIPNKKNPTFI